MNINKFFLGMLGLSALTFTACSSDDDYEPATVSGQQVYFSDQLGESFEIKADASSVSLPINRIKTDGDLTVSLTVTKPDNSKYTIPTSITFANGESVAQLPISYDPSQIVFGEYEDITIALADSAAYGTPWGATKYSFKLGITAWTEWEKWNRAGTAIYTYSQFWAGDDQQPLFYRHNTIETNLYQFLVTNWGGGIDLLVDYDEKTGIVSVPDQFTGYVHSSYGAVNVVDHNYYWQNIREGKVLGTDYELEYGSFDKEGGYLYLPVVFYVSAGYFGDGYEVVTIDGYDRADLSVEASYAGKFIDANDNYFLVVNVALGEDLSKANVGLVYGEPTEEDIAAITAGTYEPMQEITESTELRFEANELEGGDYTIVVVPFVERDAQEPVTATFTYDTAGKESWTLAGTADYTYTIFFTDEDENGEEIPYVDAGLELYKSDTRANTYKLTKWGYGVDFEFTWNPDDNTASVPEQFTGYTHSSYGQVMVADLAYYTGDAAYYENYPCVYDPETSTFHFTVTYFVEAGRFGIGEETMTVHWGAAARAAKAHKALKKGLLVK